jgi:hypothetical protein
MSSKLRLNPAEFTCHPLTPERWGDFEQLFEEHGIQNGCWCMYWRAKRADCQRGYGEGNKITPPWSVRPP